MEAQLRLKLQNENQVLKLQLSLLREQQDRLDDISALRDRNRQLRELVGIEQARIQRLYAPPAAGAVDPTVSAVGATDTGTPPARA